MSEPDEAMVEAVAQAIRAADAKAIRAADGALEGETGPALTELGATELARAALSVPVLRDALAAHAAVKKFAAQWATDDDGLMDVLEGLLSAHGDRAGSEEQR